jgi:hypothetical protein
MQYSKAANIINGNSSSGSSREEEKKEMRLLSAVLRLSYFEADCAFNPPSGVAAVGVLF